MALDEALHAEAVNKTLEYAAENGLNAEDLL
jgi:hypothetical protein